MKRYSSLPFPPYRYLPTVNRHPVDHPEGHSYQKKEEPRDDAEIFAYGVDLFNHGFWWEAHEAWEGLWQKTDKKGILGQFLAGLIQFSAFLLKIRQKQRKSGVKLGKLGLQKLKTVEEQSPVFHRMDLNHWLPQAKFFLERADRISGDPLKEKHFPFLEIQNEGSQ